MSPRSPRQFEEIREEKRALIMDVALEHFANVGFHATTINHIARHAGISKGLMYNYFSSKKELLAEIIKRSVAEIYIHLDPDRDGYLTEEEFELFVRRISSLLREKRSIWRLFFQMMMQRDVRELLIGEGMLSLDILTDVEKMGDNEFIPGVTEMLHEYFERKRTTKPGGYDPALELSMFLITLKGLAVTYIYMDADDGEDNFRKSVNRIIEIYK